MKIDEYYNHYPTVNNINELGILAVFDTTKYLAANMPLPYLITILISKTLNFELNLKNLRLLNISFSFFTIILIYYFFLSQKSRFPLEKTLIIFFYPYFLKPSFTYYMAIYGLFFYLLFLFALLNKEKKYLVAGFFISFAILSQQFYISIFLCFGLFLFIQFWQKKLNFIEILKFSLPTIILTLPFLYYWKGLVPPNFNFHSIGLDLTKITSILISIGVIAFPFVLYDLVKNKTNIFQNKNIIKISITFLILSLILALFFYPTLEKRGGFEKITGITFNSIAMIENISFFISLLMKIFFVFFGIFGFYKFIESNFLSDYCNLSLKGFIESIPTFNIQNLLLINSIFLIIGFLFNILLAERHLLPLIVTVLLLNLINFNNIIILRLILMIYIIGGSVHFYYYLFISKSF